MYYCVCCIPEYLVGVPYKNGVRLVAYQYRCPMPPCTTAKIIRISFRMVFATKNMACWGEGRGGRCSEISLNGGHFILLEWGGQGADITIEKKSALDEVISLLRGSIANWKHIVWCVNFYGEIPAFWVRPSWVLIATKGTNSPPKSVQRDASILSRYV